MEADWDIPYENATGTEAKLLHAQLRERDARHIQASIVSFEKMWA